MTSQRRLLVFNILALMCALWFLLLGWEWIYFFNIIFVFPFAIAGFLLWRKGRAAERQLLNKIVGWLFVSGLVVSIGALLAVLAYMAID